MSIGLRLEMRQTQQLVMTPQLQQAIRLLAMSNLELRAFIEQEVVDNPLLTLVEHDGSADEDAPRQDPADPEVAADKRTEDHSLSRDVFDTGAENLHDPSPSDGPSPLTESWGSWEKRGAAPPSESLGAIEDRLTHRLGLREHLRAQLGRMSLDDPTTALFARYLVEELDEHGYLRADLAEIAGRMNVDQGVAQAAMAAVQGCEPTGVGARDLAECLALQLAEQGPIEPSMRLLLDNLALLGKGEMKRLRVLCRVDADGLGRLVCRLRQLNPRPCAGFDRVDAPVVIPDIIVSRSRWGGWKIELNSDTLPRVLIDRTYRARIGGGKSDAADAFLADCHANATWLIKSLDQRARTVLKVATQIVRHQSRFFDVGIAGLRPLTLRAVAEAIGLHESTVSRVTSNKFIATDNGTFELKFFFTNAIGGDGGDVAAATVRHRIRALVDGEAPGAVLSDDALVAALRAEGVEIARRTVAKYRKSLNIPSSAERKRILAVDAGL